MEFVDKNFGLQGLKNYKLSMQISLNGFSYAIFDTISNKHVALKHIQYSRNISGYGDLVKNIDEIIETDSLLHHNYQCNCMFVSTKHTIIPESLFAEHKLRSYMDFVTPLDELDEIHFKIIPEMRAFSIYALPSPLVAKLQQRYSAIKYFNQSYKAITTSLFSFPDSIEVVFFTDFIDVTITVAGKTILNNTYETSSNQDIIYYLSALIKQLDVPRSFVLNVSGEILENQLFELKYYFPRLQIRHNQRILLLINYDTSYRYFHLLNLHECE